MAYRVFCAYPKRCGAETVVEDETLAANLVDLHEEGHNGKHSADYEEIPEHE